MRELAFSLGDIETVKKIEELKREYEPVQKLKPDPERCSLMVKANPFLSLTWALVLYLYASIFHLSRVSIKSVTRQLKNASPEQYLELLQDLIVLELNAKNHEAVDRHSRRFLELCQEAA